MADGMTTTSWPEGSSAVQAGSSGGPEVTAVAESFVGLQRTVRRSKARLLAAAGDDVESATQLVLHAVAADGPVRASVLAAILQSDLSTVSRQAAALVSRGLLERRADQADGRASVLAVTDAGRAAMDSHDAGRDAFFTEVLAGWSAGQMREFALQLDRFTAAYDRIHTAWVTGQADKRRPPGPDPIRPLATATQEEGPA